ncbi:MAG: COG1470 family protein [Fimbriimonadaceae bacterium]
MSFLARLASDLITVEAGATTPLSIELINRGDAADQFELSIEGLDPEWTAVPVPVVAIKEHETQEEKIFFKPPRVSESSAGNYPFVLRARSLTSGEARTVQGVLTVKPYHHLSVELSPKKGFVSPISHHNTFDVTLVNLGNTEHTVQLFGSDPEEGCAFELDAEQVSLGPGQQKTVLVTVNPSKQSIVSGSRLYGFSISARSIEQPSVVAVAQGQLEQRPLMSIGALATAIFVLLVVGLWIYLIPPKPSVSVLLNTQEITNGDTITVSWSTKGAPTKVHIAALGQTIYDGPAPKGEKDFVADIKPDSPATSFEITGYAEKDDHEYDFRPIRVAVKQRPPVEPPHIDVFKLDQTNIPKDSTVTATYKVTNATKALLLPMGTVLDTTVDQIQFQANDVNTKAITLKVYNGDKTDQKSIKVNVFIASKARVFAFTATPATIDGAAGDVILNWQVTNAVRIEMASDGQVKQVDSVGPVSLHVTKTTIVTLTAYDDAGVTDKKSVKITVNPPPPVPPDAGGPLPGEVPPTDTNGAGGTTGT